METLHLEKGEFLLVSAHREENIDSPEQFENFLTTLQTLASVFNRQIIVSTHPRTKKRLDEHGGVELDKRIHFLKPLGFFDYNHLQQNAFCVVSDSGTITEESAILNFPAVTIRQAHERPEGMDEGTLIMCGLKSADVVNAINVVTAQHNETARQFHIPHDYKADNVSMKVVRIIMSYTDYVNRTVWHKN
jgi:UDP-N-acetylglucosamine 2-epimerase (non-hydrolysing)